MGCNNKVFSHGFCRFHQWRRTDEKYLKAKEYAKQNRKIKKKISAESEKRKKEHIRYIDQLKMFKQEHKDNGTYFCFLSGEEFDETIDGFCTVHHLRGRTGDYYLDKEYWILARNGYHLDVFHGGCTIPELKRKYQWFDDFVKRLEKKDTQSYYKIKRREEKNAGYLDF